MREKSQRYYKKLLLAAVICLVPLLLGIVAPREKETGTAQEDTETIKIATGGVICDTVIPIGEALFETNNLLSQVFAQTENIRRETENQIKTASKILDILGENAENCRFSECKAVCKNLSIPITFAVSLWPFGDIFHIPACIAMCGAENCQGVPCPEIKPQVSAFTTSLQNITSFSNEIKNLIGPILERKKIKPVTEDILVSRFWETTVEECGGEKCAAKIPLIEYIEKKLDRARAEFKNYSVPPSQWHESLQQGILPEKFALRCKDVLEYGYEIPWADKCLHLCNPEPENKEFDEIQCVECLCGKSHPGLTGHGYNQNWLGCKRK